MRMTRWHTAGIRVGVALGLALLGFLMLPLDDDLLRLAAWSVVGLAFFGTIWLLERAIGWALSLMPAKWGAWWDRPLTHWNDWRFIILLAGVGLWLVLLGVLDMRFVDRWEAALWVLLIAVWLAIEMIRLAVGRRSRK
jgi:hypothetical protein